MHWRKNRSNAFVNNFLISSARNQKIGRMPLKFDDVEAGAPIEVFELTAAFNNDTSPVKVNLGVGGKLRIISVLI